MVNKKLMILAIFLVGLLAVSAVSAADNATSNIVIVEETTEEVVSVGENEIILRENVNSVGTFTDLANDIAKANGELNLTKNYVYFEQDSEYKKGIQINKEISINGNGFVINGDNQAKAFRIQSDNVTLSNVSIFNCYSQNEGGAISWYGNSGTLINCTFNNNIANNYHGGAIYWEGFNRTLINCTFTHNSVNDRYDWLSTFGGAIYINLTQNKEDYLNNREHDFGNYVNCSFIDNSAKSGSAIYVRTYNPPYTNETYYNCYCINCDIHVSAKSTVYNSNISLAMAHVISFYNSNITCEGRLKTNIGLPKIVDMGSFYNSNLRFSGNGTVSSTFSECNITCKDKIKVFGDFIKCNVNSTSRGTFTNCNVSGVSEGTFTNCNLNHVLIQNCDLTFKNIINCKYDSCKFNLTKESEYKISNRIFNSCALIINNNLIISNCTFDNYDDGNAIEFYGNSAIIHNCNFKKGSVFLNKTYDSQVYDCNFTNNAFIWNSINGTLNNCNFNSSKLELSGYANFKGNNIINSIFFNCNDCPITSFKSSISNCFFKNNKKCIDLMWGTISNCTFINNYNGAMSIDQLKVINCTFINNSADNGGAIKFNIGNIYVQSYTISDCIFINNSARYNGGAICSPDFDKNINYTISNCIFINNSASYGGAIYRGKYINKCIFINNSAEQGGGIYFKAQKCSLINSMFESNVAKIGSDWYSVYPLIIINDTKISTVLSAPDVTNTYGTSETLVVTLKDADNNILAGEKISIVLNNRKYLLTTNSKGQASLYIPSNLTPKTYVATITYDGNDKYDSSVTTVNVIVNKASTALTASNVVTDYNTGKYFTAALKDANGKAVKDAMVTLKIGSVTRVLYTDANGQVLLTTDGLLPDIYTITATFDGDNIYDKSGATAKITINKLDTILTAEYDVDSKNIVANVKDVNDKPVSGIIVSFNLDGIKYIATDSNGQAKYSISGLAEKAYSIDVMAQGNNIYKDSNKVIVKFDLSKISTTLTASNVVTNYNSGKNLVATLKDANGKAISGAKVTVKLGTTTKTLTTNSNGQVSLTTDGLIPDTYVATISFEGNDVYDKSSTTAKVTINKLDIILTARYDAGSKNIVATVKNANGNPVKGLRVGFALNGVKYVDTDAEGQAKYSTVGLADGTYNVNVQAYENEIYKDSNKETLTFTIGSKEMSKIFLRNALYFVTQVKMVQVTLWDGNNQPLSNKTVYIRAYDSIWHGVTDENGDAYVRVGIGFGVHDATVGFEGDDDYNSSTRAGYIRVIKQTPSVMVRGADSQFKAGDSNKVVKVHLRDRYNQPLIANSKIVFKLNGKTYVGTTDINGVASIEININTVGTFTAQAMYGGNSAFNAVTRDIKIRIV